MDISRGSVNPEQKAGCRQDYSSQIKKANKILSSVVAVGFLHGDDYAAFYSCP